MGFIAVYWRVMLTLGRDLRIATLLGGANLIVAIMQFLDPLLFGRVIEMMAHADTLPTGALWAQASGLIGVWAALGATSIGANILVALHAERLAHRNRLHAMHRFFAHVLSLPPSFHGEAQSGRLMKVMLSGSDAMFGVWLTFFREALATFVSMLVLLPLTMFMN